MTDNIHSEDSPGQNGVEPGGTVYLVGAGPGDPELITVRGARLLEEADVVFHDRLVGPELLEGLEAEIVYVGKHHDGKRTRQERINDLLVERARLGDTVVRLKGGDPTVFGRGGEELLYLQEHGVDCEVVPGVTSAVAAASQAGIPVTHRGVADGFTVVTAHRRDGQEDFSIPPFHPRRTLVLLMGVGTMEVWRDRLIELDYPVDLPVALVTRASWENQTTLTTTVADCVEDAERHEVEPPTTAIVGDVVAMREAVQFLELYAGAGGRIFLSLPLQDRQPRRAQFAQ